MPSSISAEGGPPRSVGRLARVLACDGARRALPLRLGELVSAVEEPAEESVGRGGRQDGRVDGARI